MSTTQSHHAHIRPPSKLETFGFSLKTERENKGISILKMAEHSGMSRETIRKAESTGIISTHRLLKYCECLGIDLYYTLITLSNQPQDELFEFAVEKVEGDLTRYLNSKRGRNKN